MKYFPALTGLRAIVAYMVFFHHFNFLSEYKEGSIAARIFDEFYIGVSIFFVLSGFLIYHRYADQFRMGKVKWSEYIRNRFARVYPMYFFITTATFIVTFLTERTLFSDRENLILYFLNITFLKGFFASFKYNGVVQTWTLVVEECFYLLAPIIFIYFRSVRIWLVVVAAMYAIGFLLTKTLGKIELYGLFGDLQFTYAFTIFGRLFEFVAGMFLASRVSRMKKTKRPGMMHTTGGAFFILACSYLLALVKQIFDVQQGIFHAYGIVLNNLLLPVGIVWLMYGLLIESNYFSNLLSTKLFDLLGKSSYVFYLIHMGIVYNLVYYIFPFDRYFVPFIILNLIAVMLYKYVEAPLYRRLGLRRPLDLQLVNVDGTRIER